MSRVFVRYCTILDPVLWNWMSFYTMMPSSFAFAFCLSLILLIRSIMSLVQCSEKDGVFCFHGNSVLDLCGSLV